MEYAVTVPVQLDPGCHCAYHDQRSRQAQAQAQAQAHTVDSFFASPSGYDGATRVAVGLFYGDSDDPVLIGDGYCGAALDDEDDDDDDDDDSRRQSTPHQCC